METNIATKLKIHQFLLHIYYKYYLSTIQIKCHKSK